MTHTPEIDTHSEKEANMKPGISSSVVGDATKSKVYWTPEPWKVDVVNYPTDIYASPDERHIGPTLIAQTKNVDYPYQMAQANAARIVACVNGCAGLNPAAYRACVEALRTMIEVVGDWDDAEGDPGWMIEAKNALTLAEQP